MKTKLVREHLDEKYVNSSDEQNFLDDEKEIRDKNGFCLNQDDGEEPAKDETLTESLAYYCGTCGERAEHEEIEDNPGMKCPNCGDCDWQQEH